MLVHCLIFSLNLSKFRSLEKASDLPLLKAQPSYRGPTAKVRWSPSDSPASSASPFSSAQQRPNSSPLSPRRPAPHPFSPSLSLTRGARMSSSSPSRPRVGLEPEFELGSNPAAPPSHPAARTPMRGPRPYLRSRRHLRRPRALKP